LVVLAIIAGCIVSRGVQMPTTDNVDKKYLQQIADQILSKFKEIETEAYNKLKSMTSRHYNGGALAAPHLFRDPNPIASIASIKKSELRHYQALLTMPASARVIYVDEKNVQKVYYISTYAPTGLDNMASYYSQVGRLAALEVGDQCDLSPGNKVVLKEKINLYPQKDQGEWDSLNSYLVSDVVDELTIKSLRQLLTEVVENIPEDLLGKILAEEAIKSNIIRGMQRQIITQMGIRNQPILDKIQDDIFRLPINERILLVGPAGTGKTTTLIKRLAQKSDFNYLTDEEKNLVSSAKSYRKVNHENNWIMFTPTELLALYLRDSFGRENVVVAADNISAWNNHKRNLARNIFRILKNAQDKGTFVERTENQNVPVLKQESLDNPRGWFADFDRWQRLAFAEELYDSANRLANSSQSEIAGIGDKYLSEMARSNFNITTTTFERLVTMRAESRRLAEMVQSQIDDDIKRIVNVELAKNQTFLNQVAKILKVVDDVNDDINEIDEIDDEDLPTSTYTESEKTQKEYFRIIRQYARMKALGRSGKGRSKFVRVTELSLKESIDQYDFPAIGQNMLLLDSLRPFKDPVRRYIEGISRRYQKFRDVRQEIDQKWYESRKFNPKNIQPLELDIVLLAVLRSADQLISKPSIQYEIDQPEWGALKPMMECYYNQVFVDEATDFSPIQLACMAALTHPRMRSFFAAGDFNQRLTEWGVRNEEELKWVFGDLNICEVKNSYRHTEPLKHLADNLIQIMNNDKLAINLSANDERRGIKPALLESYTNRSEMLLWLAERIREIETFVETLPSIAIFVNSENEVSDLAEGLNNILIENAINVVACSNGMVVGQGKDVRVFDIQHIKGLEFEAVFFINVDHLAQIKPHIFEKYLYVGFTRAATYLGLTSQNRLPSRIETLRPHFTRDWGTH